MAKFHIATKRMQIDKTQSTIVAVTAVAAFIFIFTCFAAKALYSQASYQKRVIAKKEKAGDQLEQNKKAVEQLQASYKAFVGISQNAIGGNPSPTAKGPRDGDNAKITLDALPSKYDFPALATSLEKLLSGKGLQIQNITGTDDEVAQAGDKGSAKPEAVAMPFEITVTGSYTAMQDLIKTFGLSIRPFKIDSIQLAGGEGNMTMTLKAQTFYQPEKTFNVTKEVVK